VSRPPGEIRAAALREAHQLVEWQRASDRPVGVTWRSLAEVLVPQGVARDAVRYTWKNLTRTPAMQRVGAVRVQGSARPMVAYVPVAAPAATHAAPAGVCALEGVARSWVSCR
jgi:hypothetical protein